MVRDLDETALVAAESEPVPPRPWPHQGSDIPADPEAVWGALDNGLRYVILRNAEPPSRISLRLHVAAGSLMESEDQRGLAHFLEHMVFNGTRNHTAAELIPRMQRLGIAFGAHANAYTSFDETVYMLDLPDLSEETMRLAFTVMRDFGDGALLEQEEIDNERGVILAEKAGRDSVGMRIMEQQFQRLLPDSLLTDRFPIGKREVIESAQRDRFVDFYTRYYTPARMTMVVVGDVEVDTMKEKIEHYFSGMENPEKPGEDPDYGPVRIAEGVEVAVFADPELTASEVSLSILRPLEPRADTVAGRHERLPLNLAHAMLSRRLDVIAREEGSPVASGSASRSELVGHIEFGSIEITAADGRWREAVSVLEQELRRAQVHGFSDGELEEAKANLRNAYQQVVRQKPTRRSDGLATVLTRSIHENAVFSSPETNLEILEDGLALVDPETCAAMFRDFWDAPGHHLILTTIEAEYGAQIELAALFEESRGIEVAAPAARAVPVFAYADFGPPGSVASQRQASDLGITKLVLSNGARINLKPTKYEEGRIRMLARAGSGKLGQPAATPMLDLFASAVFNGGGLGHHSVDDLRRILAGKTAGTVLEITDDAFQLSGVTTPDDLELQLQLMCAVLSDPGWRNEGLWDFQKAIPMIEQQLRHTTAGPLQQMNAWLHGEDFRHRIASMGELAAYTIDEVRRWVEPELQSGYLELSIVGDFDEDTLLPLLLGTFGALAARDEKPPAHEDARKINFPESPARVEFSYVSRIPQAMAVVIWPTPGPREGISTFRRLNVLASIYADRLREELRENLGATYSPSAGADGSDVYDGVGFIIGQTAAKPDDVEMLVETMRDLAASLAVNGATQDKLDRALNPLLGMLDRSLRDNSYWLNTVMSRCQVEPERLDFARSREQDYQSITLDEINALAADHLAADNALLVRIVPQEQPNN